MIRISIILIWLSTPAFSQLPGMVGSDLTDHLLIKQAKSFSNSSEIEVEGSPYLNEVFVAGEVTTFNKKFVNIPMRYNIYDDNIEFKQNNSVFVLDAEPRIKKVKLGGETFVVEKLEVRGKVKFGFLSLLDSGKLVLMSKKMIYYTPQQEPKALQSAATPAKFVDAPTLYFYKIGKTDVTKIGGLKNLIESLPDKQEEVNQFAKKQKLTAKKEEDLLKLVKYYNSL